MKTLTREEKRAMYAEGASPTVANEVTPDTPLEALNLNWRERDLPERERTKHVHRLHPYLGKYIPQLVEIFLRKYFRSGQTILDPFCGSGTTLVQASELGINSVGCDISAFNVMMCKAKLGEYDLQTVRQEAFDILERVRAETSNGQYQPVLWQPWRRMKLLSESDSEYLKKWFAPQSLRELLAYRHHIESGRYKYVDLLKVILCRSARSARLTTHFDLDFPKKPQLEPYYCYKHSRTCSPTQGAYKFLERYTMDTIPRLLEYSRARRECSATVLHVDSRNAILPKIDGVITSPPYVGLIDYHEQHAYAFHLLGLEDKRGDEIGPAARGSSRDAVTGYEQDIAQVFRNACSSMPSGGRLVVVAYDKMSLYEKISQMIGVESEAVIHRHVNRRTGRRTNAFYESVLIWRKP